LNQELNFEEFSDATERLLKTLSVNERAEILGFNERKASENLSFSFQVFIWIFGKSLLNLLAGNQWKIIGIGKKEKRWDKREKYLWFLYKGETNVEWKEEKYATFQRKRRD